MAIGDLNQARERAEQLLQNLQKRARILWPSEANLRQLVDSKAAKETARRMFDEAVAKVKTSPLGQTLQPGEVEKLVGRLRASLSVASKAELAEVDRQIKNLNKKINELAKKLGSNVQAS